MTSVIHLSIYFLEAKDNEVFEKLMERKRKKNLIEKKKTEMSKDR